MNFSGLNIPQTNNVDDIRRAFVDVLAKLNQLGAQVGKVDFVRVGSANQTYAMPSAKGPDLALTIVLTSTQGGTLSVAAAGGPYSLTAVNDWIQCVTDGSTWYALGSKLT